MIASFPQKIGVVICSPATTEGALLSKATNRVNTGTAFNYNYTKQALRLPGLQQQLME